MHIVSKFQFFIHIFAMVKLKKTDQKFERGGKNELKLLRISMKSIEYLLISLNYIIINYFLGFHHHRNWK